MNGNFHVRFSTERGVGMYGYGKKYLNPLHPLSIKRLFGSDEHKPETISMLNSFLRLEGNDRIQSIEFLDKEQLPDTKEKRRSIVDVKCIDQKGDTFIIEMQNAEDAEDFIKRSQLYAYSSAVIQARKGRGGIKGMGDVTVLLIVNFNMIPNDQYPINYYDMRNTRTGHKEFNMTSYAVVNLLRYKQNKKKGIVDDLSNKEEGYWLEFLSSIEEKLDNPPPNVPEEVKQAYIAMERARWSQPMLDAYMQAILEREAYELGMEKAEKKGREEGESIGLEKGREEGESIGLEKGKIEMAKAMLADGESVEKIAKYSGLTPDQIKKLK